MMDMDWKFVAVALALTLVLSATIFAQTSFAAGGNNSSVKSTSGTTTQSNKTNQSSKANNTGLSNKIKQQSQGYVPLGGPGGKGINHEGMGTQEKGWMGAPMNNPWIYGPSTYPRRQVRNFWRCLDS
jgi:hypothetical protein